jgi:hypothetical protein
MARGRKLESTNDYQKALKNKYGIGEGSEYKPWLEVRDVKSQGIRAQIYGHKVQRIHHLMSSIETELFYLLEFSDNVIDIREQFPILPLNLSLKVAKHIGVEHPIHPKSKEPIVITTDFLATVKIDTGIEYRAFSVKPEDEIKSQRTLEKIDIERVCWQLLGVQFNLFTGNALTQTQSKNISWITSTFRESPTLFDKEQLDSALSNLNEGKQVIEDICNRFVAQNIVSVDHALTLLRYLIAYKYVEVDMGYAIAESGVVIIDKVHKELKRPQYGTL